MALIENISEEALVKMVSILADTAMVAITVISVVCAFLAYFYQKNRNKKTVACELALYYADVILKENRFLNNVFKGAGVSAHIRAVLKDMNSLQHFDSNELKGFLEEAGTDPDEFKRKLNEIDGSVIVNCRRLHDESANAFIEFDEETGEQRIRNESILRTDLTNSIYDLLNHLEWFGMNCRYRLADEKLVYQSLHETYLSMIWMLYPYICFINSEGKDKRYTNAIWLFFKWRKRMRKISKKTQRKKKLLTKLADRIQKLADNIRAKEFSGRRL
ncbi:MAG: hypothetical protein IKT52_13515 [Oscillospiraceae bacterium]|nr:hypothetical protein [Oscillospiraceae bacterium]